MPLTEAEERERWERGLAVERKLRREHVLARLYWVAAALVSVVGFMAVGALGFAYHLGADVSPSVAGILAVLSCMTLWSAHVVARDGGF